ncbi:MAG TPA: hypothetical protein VGG74_09770 [Kofleriaceae bacterium]
MARYACPRCGTISDTEPCVACGGPAFDLDNETEREELRFTLSRQRRMRAVMPALAGAAVGIGVAVLLNTRYLVSEPLPWLFAVAFGAIAGLKEPAKRAALDGELAARGGGGSANRSRVNATVLAVAGLLIAARIGVSVHGHTSTMPRADAERIASTRVCEIAKRCDGKLPLLCDISNEITVMLASPRARVDRDTVDDCLAALDDLEIHHEACTSPAPQACRSLISESVPQILLRGHELEHDIDRTLDQQLRRH